MGPNTSENRGAEFERYVEALFERDDHDYEETDNDEDEDE